MNRFLLLALVGAAGCAQESDRGEPPPTASPAQEVAIPMQPQVTKTEAVLPLPEDKAQLERMVTMGYTPHDDHLHPPGVKECPISMGGNPIQ